MPYEKRKREGKTRALSSLLSLPLCLSTRLSSFSLTFFPLRSLARPLSKQDSISFIIIIPLPLSPSRFHLFLPLSLPLHFKQSPSSQSIQSSSNQNKTTLSYLSSNYILNTRTVHRHTTIPSIPKPSGGFRTARLSTMSTPRPSEEGHTSGTSPGNNITHIPRHPQPHPHAHPHHQRPHFNNSFDQPTEPFECDVSAILPYDDDDEEDEDEDEEDENQDEDEEDIAYPHSHDEERETRSFPGHMKVINEYISSCVTQLAPNGCSDCPDPGWLTYGGNLVRVQGEAPSIS